MGPVENVHRFALIAIRGKLWREKGRKREREKERERNGEKERDSYGILYMGYLLSYSKCYERYRDKNCIVFTLV